MTRRATRAVPFAAGDATDPQAPPAAARAPGRRIAPTRRAEKLPRALTEVVGGLVEEYSGLVLMGVHERALEQGIARRIQASGCSGILEYLVLLRSHRTDELQSLIEALANSETTFFRNRAHFRALREVVLPGLATRDAPVSIWSAGCSTGEEPYGIAIACLESGLAGGGRRVSILGTDISRLALDTARRGEYSERRLANVQPEVRARYFERHGERWRVNGKVRDLVSFLQHNLVDRSLPMPAGSVDILFCQNVLIYFRPEVVGSVAERLATALGESGTLFPGFSETAWYRIPALRSVSLDDCFLYRKAPADFGFRISDLGLPVPNTLPAAPESQAAGLPPSPLPPLTPPPHTPPLPPQMSCGRRSERQPGIRSRRKRGSGWGCSAGARGGPGMRSGHSGGCSTWTRPPRWRTSTWGRSSGRRGVPPTPAASMPRPSGCCEPFRRTPLLAA